MPEWLIAIFILYLIYLYFPMKTPKSSTENPESKSTTEQVITPVVPAAKPKKASPARKAPKKAQDEPAKPASKAKDAQPVASVVKEVIPKKAANAPKKPQAEPAKPASKAKVEQPVAPVLVAEAKPDSPAKAPKKAKAVAAKSAVETTEMTAPERAGLTAGSIWHYLADNGATSVANLVKALPEDEKTIQRSIGWLAQEGKISLDLIDRVETITLKE